MRKKFLLLPMLLVGMWTAGIGQVTLTLNFDPNQPNLLIADAGVDTSVCVDQSLTLGGSPAHSGGTSPYTYAWTPTTDLSSATVANPVFTPTSGPSSVDFAFVVTDARGCTSADTTTITVDTCATSVSIPGVGSFSLFPNPSNGVFTVDIQIEKIVGFASLSVVTTEGREVYRNTYSVSSNRLRQEVKLPAVSKGYYFVNIDLGGSILSRKILVQ